MPSSRSVIFVASLAGCAATTQENTSFSSATQAPPPKSATAPPRAKERWEHFAALESWPDLSSSPFVSGHLDGRHRAVVRVNAVARDAYLALVQGTELPVGSIIVELLHDAEHGRAGPTFTMQKLEPGRWRFAVIEPDGSVASSTSTLCERCHAEAVSDHVFGLPETARPTAR